SLAGYDWADAEAFRRRRGAARGEPELARRGGAPLSLAGRARAAPAPGARCAACDRAQSRVPGHDPKRRGQARRHPGAGTRARGRGRARGRRALDAFHPERRGAQEAPARQRARGLPAPSRRAGGRLWSLGERPQAGEGLVSYGRILVAQYVRAGRVLSGVGWVPERPARDAFYDLDGRSLKKSFLKSPLEFTRITSGFTYARPHPILGGVRPHLAIDYAAPVGTPVRAVADGVVSAAGWDGGNGVSVTIRPRSGSGTLYNHLSK